MAAEAQASREQAAAERAAEAEKREAAAAERVAAAAEQHRRELAAAMEEARVVVCVGYGLGQEGVPEAQRLAERLGGVVGGTRRVCDLGWLPRQAQIGLSGRSIAPDLYIGLGARGSFNHTVGLRRAGTIVAVNNDPGADFFEGADLGVVGDARVFLTELLAQLD